MNLLPTTPTKALENPKWSYLYISNVRILRNIFVYCARMGKINEKKLYADMAEGLIAPPKNKWVNAGIARTERLRLEYIHAALYLKLLKRVGTDLEPDFSTFHREKESIITENSKAQLDTDYCFSDAEKMAFTKILIHYQRAADFLYWFLDFENNCSKPANLASEVKTKGTPIFFPTHTSSEFRGSTFLRKGTVSYAIPKDYIRLVNNFFTNWFSDLGLIDHVVLFSDFSPDEQMWRMYYPIKGNPTLEEFKQCIHNTFLADKDKTIVSVPLFMFRMAIEHGFPVADMKKKLELLYQGDSEHFYLERTSLQIMKNRSKYKSSYLYFDGFYYSSIILLKGASHD